MPPQYLTKKSKVEKTFSLGSLLAMGFTFFLSWHAITPILPLYSVDLGSSIFLTGVIVSMFPGTILIAIIPFGFIAQRVGSLKLLIFSFLTQIAALSILAAAWTPILLLVGWGLYGVASSSFFPVSTSLSLSKASSNDRGTITGKFYTALGAGMVIGPILVGLLTQYLSYNQVITCLIIFPLSGFFILARSLIRRIEIPIVKGNSQTFGKSIKRILTNVNVAVIFVVNILYFIAVGAFDTYFPLYAVSTLGFTASTISLLFATRGGFNVLFRGPSGALSDRVGRKKLLTVAIFLLALNFIVLIFTRQLVYIGVAMALFGLLWALRLPSASAVLGDSLPKDNFPLATAIWYACGFAGSMGGSLIAGIVGSTYSYHILMMPLISLLVISTILIFILFTEK